jgi:hypothetical protein
MMHSTPVRAFARLSPVITSTPRERDIATTACPPLLEHVNDMTPEPTGGASYRNLPVFLHDFSRISGHTAITDRDAGM